MQKALLIRKRSLWGGVAPPAPELQSNVQIRWCLQGAELLRVFGNSPCRPKILRQNALCCEAEAAYPSLWPLEAFASSSGSSAKLVLPCLAGQGCTARAMACCALQVTSQAQMDFVSGEACRSVIWHPPLLCPDLPYCH